MNYTSAFFLLLFLMIHLLTQALIPSSKGKNIALLLSSLVVYIWSGPIYLLVLLGVTLIAWLLGMALSRPIVRERKKLIVICGLVVIIGTLVVLKYGEFLLSTSQQLFGVPEVLPDMVIPIGISIYTLRLISYLIDVYRSEIPAETNYFNLLLWSSLFYGVSVGPLFRYAQIRKALSGRKFKLQGLNKGISRICLGMAKKYLLADSLTILVSQYLVRSRVGLSAVPVTGLWLGICLSALRMYLQFSAYADVAVGLSLASGLPVEENFQYSLCSISVTGLISKWFISIGDFFRDYVQAPVTHRSSSRLLGYLVCYALFGLWFGGSWSYVLWGILVALLLFVETRYLSKLPAVLSALLGIAGIFLFFTLLSFTTLPRLGIALKGLLGLNGNGFYQASTFHGLAGALPLILSSVLFALPTGTIVHNLWYARYQKQPNMLIIAAVWESAWPLILLVLTVVFAVWSNGTAFLIFE